MRGETLMRILHTNDFHNRLTDEKAARLRRAIEEEKPDLILDSGDAVKAGNMGFCAGGEPILRRMTEMGYNAMCCGNREFHISSKVFSIKVKDAGFPIVCANMRRKSGRSRCYLPDRSVVFEIKGKRVGVFGLLVPMVTEKMAARIVSDYFFYFVL
jgi:2',3'-cyclic-nucleotide 2'-phosphodiesterase (5'-nucleotidase family)